MTLATIGVLLTAAITAPAAKYALDLNWTEASLNGVCGATGVCGAPRDAKLLLFPIPVTQLGSNPLLVQNPGY